MWSTVHSRIHCCSTSTLLAGGVVLRADFLEKHPHVHHTTREAASRASSHSRLFRFFFQVLPCCAGVFVFLCFRVFGVGGVLNLAAFCVQRTRMAEGWLHPNPTVHGILIGRCCFLRFGRQKQKEA